MKQTGEFCLRLPPAVAGGRLLWLNRVLHLCAQARHQPTSCVRLAFDVELLQEVDHQLLMLDAKGSPLAIEGPPLEGWTEAERAAVLAATRDRIPATGESEAALHRLLPRPEESLLDAALELWSDLLPIEQLGVELSLETADASHQDWPTVEQLDTAGEVLWLSARHRQTMRELGIELELLLQGEDELLQSMKERDHGTTRATAKRMHQELEAGLRELRTAIREESPGLLGSWNRYRRAAMEAASDFSKAAERFERNRKGIRGSRLHALAQAVRPGGASQEQGLSLLCAMALFRLQPSDAVEQIDMFHGPQEQHPKVVFSGIGISAPRSLS